uniref:Uncharacterized protein n=1 Tax=Tetranychus urticae TaxID=32264 RepID=T1JXN9_TETUR
MFCVEPVNDKSSIKLGLLDFDSIRSIHLLIALIGSSDCCFNANPLIK